MCARWRWHPAHTKRDDLANGIVFLKQAEEACDENGDAWYYRSVFERQLGQGNPQYSMGKARDRGSKAFRDAEDPFRLATPERGVAIGQRPGTADKKSARSAQDVHKPDVSQKWALVVGVANFRKCAAQSEIYGQGRRRGGAIATRSGVRSFPGRSCTVDRERGSHHREYPRGIGVAGAAGKPGRSRADRHRDARLRRASRISPEPTTFWPPTATWIRGGGFVLTQRFPWSRSRP